jgi:glycosyltransferase involved in cell wall biosynthesis
VPFENDELASPATMSAAGILFTVSHLHPENGGLARSVPALSHALAGLGLGVEIFCLHHGTGFGKPLAPAAVPVNFVDCQSALLRRARWSPRFSARLRERCRAGSFQIIHDNGVWLPTNHGAAVVSRDLKLARIVSPRGMLAAWSLRQRGWKKRMAFRFYQRRDLQTAQVLHATSPAEAAEFRALGLTAPVAVVPNGVELPPAVPQSAIGNRQSAIQTILFLSRIHPKKGLQNLVQAWATLKAANPQSVAQWRIVVAGGDEGGHLEVIKAEIRAAGLASDFQFLGPVDGLAKWELYRAADLFVLPTHAENFGLVIAEALACGVPVITTTGTPWAELTSNRCGWWIGIGAEPLAAALREAVAAPREALAAMGERGRQLIEAKYVWPQVAKQMCAVYGWMLGRNEKPGFVQDRMKAAHRQTLPAL